MFKPKDILNLAPFLMETIRRGGQIGALREAESLESEDWG